jgi:hypothetical protein
MNRSVAALVVAALTLAAPAVAKEPAKSASKAAAFPEIAPYPDGVRVKPRLQFTSAEKKGHEAAASSAERMIATARSDAFVTDDAPDKIAAHYEAALKKIGFAKSSDTPSGEARSIAYTKDMIMVQVQIHTKRPLWQTYLADGEKPPAKANCIFLTTMDLNAMLRAR